MARPARPVVIVADQPRPVPPLTDDEVLWFRSRQVRGSFGPHRDCTVIWAGLAVTTVTGRTDHLDDATVVRIGQDAIRRAYQFYGEHAELKIESFGALHLVGRGAMAAVRIRCLNFGELFDQHGRRRPPEPS